MVHDIAFAQFHDSLDDIAPPCASYRLFGHHQSVGRLIAGLSGGHHAFILDGEQGIGKATAAFHVANMLLDSGRDLDGTLKSLDRNAQIFRQVAQNVHPNLLYLTCPLRDDGKTFKTVITVDEVRRLQRFLGMTSSSGENRIIIIDSLGDMNSNAANALLKLLEEPPLSTYFILISHGLGGLLPTIRSRCQLIRFTPLSTSEVNDVLCHVAGGILTENEITQVVSISEGSVRQALLMARYGGLELRDNLVSFLTSSSFDTAIVHKLADVAGTRGNSTHNVLLRDMILAFVRQKAVESVEQGEMIRADKLARFDGDYRARIRIADGFNLDRKQEFIVMATQVHALFHG